MSSSLEKADDSISNGNLISDGMLGDRTGYKPLNIIFCSIGEFRSFAIKSAICEIFLVTLDWRHHNDLHRWTFRCCVKRKLNILVWALNSINQNKRVDSWMLEHDAPVGIGIIKSSFSFLQSIALDLWTTNVIIFIWTLLTLHLLSLISPAGLFVSFARSIYISRNKSQQRAFHVLQQLITFHKS